MPISFCVTCSLIVHACAHCEFPSSASRSPCSGTPAPPPTARRSTEALGVARNAASRPSREVTASSIATLAGERGQRRQQRRKEARPEDAVGGEDDVPAPRCEGGGGGAHQSRSAPRRGRRRHCATSRGGAAANSPRGRSAQRVRRRVHMRRGPAGPSRRRAEHALPPRRPRRAPSPAVDDGQQRHAVEPGITSSAASARPSKPCRRRALASSASS